MDIIRNLSDLNGHPALAPLVASCEAATCNVDVLKKYGVKFFREYSHIRRESSGGYEADENTKCPGHKFWAFWLWELEPMEHDQTMYSYSIWHGSAMNVLVFSASVDVSSQKGGPKIWMQSGDVGVYGNDSENQKKNHTRQWYTTNGVVRPWNKHDIGTVGRVIQAIEDSQQSLAIEERLKAILK